MAKKHQSDLLILTYFLLQFGVEQSFLAIAVWSSDSMDHAAIVVLVVVCVCTAVAIVEVLLWMAARSRLVELSCACSLYTLLETLETAK